jgi:hypothetical protein
MMTQDITTDDCQCWKGTKAFGKYCLITDENWGEPGCFMGFGDCDETFDTVYVAFENDFHSIGNENNPSNGIGTNDGNYTWWTPQWKEGVSMAFVRIGKDSLRTAPHYRPLVTRNNKKYFVQSTMKVLDVTKGIIRMTLHYFPEDTKWFEYKDAEDRCTLILNSF